MENSKKPSKIKGLQAFYNVEKMWKKCGNVENIEVININVENEMWKMWKTGKNPVLEPFIMWKKC